jgi:hypothetical protein
MRRDEIEGILRTASPLESEYRSKGASGARRLVHSDIVHQGLSLAMAAVLLLVVIGGLAVRFGLVGFGGIGAEPQPTGVIAVPSPNPTKGVPAATVAPTPVALSLCKPSDLSLSLIGWGPAMGTTYFNIQITSKSAPCALPATPAVSIVGSTGASLVSAPASEVSGASTNDLIGLTSVLKAEVGWSSWCGAAVGPTTLSLEISPGQAVRLPLPTENGPSCEGGPSTVSVQISSP